MPTAQAAIRPDDRFVDIGAHCGHYGLTAASQLPSSGLDTRCRTVNPLDACTGLVTDDTVDCIDLSAKGLLASYLQVYGQLTVAPANPALVMPAISEEDPSMTKRSAALLGFLSAMIATTVVASTTEASATLLITDNWRYTTSNTSSTSDASASYSPLTFTNLVAPDGLSGETSATAQGTATAFEDLLGGNSASVDLEFTFQFSVNKSKPLFIVLLADQLTGSLSLQDTESDPGGASYFSNATLVRTNTNAVVASLPSRVGLRRAEGTSTVNESVLFGSNVFSIPNGDYSLTGTLNLDAVATAGVGDDRVQSSFKYQVKMRWVEVPAPPTVLLLLAGLAALPFCAGRARWRAA